MTSIRHRRGAAALWSTTNPVLPSGEFGVETDTLRIKMGDGVTTWNSLAYITDEVSGLSTATPNAVIKRDSFGRASVVEPTSASEIATKGYVDLKTPDAQWPYLLGNKIGFVGDSYSSGYGLTNPTTERWPKLLSNMVGATENNVAVPSSGYVNQGSGGNSKFSTQAGLLDTNCQTVIMCGGINDAPLGQTDAQMATAVTAAISAIQSRCPAATIIVVSPMWHAGEPSPELLKVEDQIRDAIPTGIRFIERGPWIRLDRVEWQIFDGHPNAAGATAIAAWMRDQLGGTPNGAVYGHYVVPGTADVTLNQTNYPGWELKGATIWNAKSGWWDLSARLVMYNSVNGNLWVRENSRKVYLRSDSFSTLPMEREIHTEFYHPGGDLPIGFGYDANNTTTKVITSGNSKVWAKYLGAK